MEYPKHEESPRDQFDRYLEMTLKVMLEHGEITDEEAEEKRKNAHTIPEDTLLDSNIMQVAIEYARDNRTLKEEFDTINIKIEDEQERLKAAESLAVNDIHISTLLSKRRERVQKYFDLQHRIHQHTLGVLISTSRVIEMNEFEPNPKKLKQVQIKPFNVEQTNAEFAEIEREIDTIDRELDERIKNKKTV